VGRWGVKIRATLQRKEKLVDQKKKAAVRDPKTNGGVKAPKTASKPLKSVGRFDIGTQRRSQKKRKFGNGGYLCMLGSKVVSKRKT